MGKKTFYKVSNFIDGRGCEPMENAGILVEDKVIVKVGKEEEFQVGEDVEVVNLQGKSIMPGMINCHLHVIMEPIADPNSILLRESDAKAALRGVRNLKKLLKSGVTFFRDMGGANGVDLDLRDFVNQGLIEGPNFLASGKVLTMTGGHGWQMGRECDGVDEVRKAAREQLRAGADIIKIMATGGVMTPGVEPGSPQLTYEEIKVAVEEAQKAGKKTATHAQGTTGIKNAVLAGINSVEHGIFLDDEVIQMMVERGTYLVPTLVAPYFIVVNGIEKGIPAYAVEKAKRVMNSHIESFQNALKAGVKIAMGTDAGTPFNLHDKTAYELKLMVEAGMTPMQAIVAATKSAAELLGVDASYGTLEEGKFADFIVLGEDPLENIETVLEVEKVYKHGKLVE